MVGKAFHHPSILLFPFLHTTHTILLGSGTNRKKKSKKTKRKRDSVRKGEDAVTTPMTMTDETEAVDLRQKPPGPTKPPRTHSATASLILSSREASVDRAEVPGLDDSEDEDGATVVAAARAALREDKEAALAADQPRAGAGDQQAAAAPRDADHVEVAQGAPTAPRELGARPKVYPKKKTKSVSDNHAEEVAEPAVSVPREESGPVSKNSGGSDDVREDNLIKKTEKASLNPLANKRSAKKETTPDGNHKDPGEKAQPSSKSTDAAPRNPLANKKVGEEKASMNPLAKKQGKAPLNKQMSVQSLGSRRGSEPAEGSIPNFRMARATVVRRQESRKSKKPRQAKMLVDQDGSRTFVEDSSSSEEEEEGTEAVAVADGDGSDGDVDLELPEFHLELFSMNPDLKKVKQKMMRSKQQKSKKKAADKSNPAMVKGLTAEEERQLEEAKRAAEERARRKEEERKEKVKRAEAEREAKLVEMSKKVESFEGSESCC